jgi:hypothetical protein
MRFWDPGLRYVRGATLSRITGDGVAILERRLIVRSWPTPTKTTAMTDTVTVRNPAIRLKAAVPTFLVADVGATASWYTKALGWESEVRDPNGYILVFSELTD